MIELKNVSISYKDKQILDKVSIEIPNSGINFLMGKNGSGKTTLIKCLLNFMDYEGEIETNCKRHNIREIFVIFDDSSLYKELTGLENIMQFTSCKKKTALEFSQPYLSGDLLNKKAKTYSYGERKKIFLIMVEILKPKIIIMDEVSNGLDYETMLLLKKRFIDLSKNSLILMTGHQFEFYKNIVSRVFVINNKTITKVEIMENESLENIYEQTIL